MSPSPRLVLALAGPLLLCGLALAAFTPRDDVVVAPDAVVVLGGVGIDRAQLGIALEQEHDATLVLSSSAAIFGERLGRDCGRDAICIDPQPETTRGEARSVATLAERHGWSEVAVVTSRAHTTRARVLFRQCLGDDVRVVGSTPSRGQPPLLTRRNLREVLGTVAAVTFQRAC